METTTPQPRIAGSEDLSDVYERYGKSDFLASILGMLTALGVLAFLGAVIAAGAGGIDYQLNIITADGELSEASVIGLLVAAAVVLASFLVGGFAAGRMARYNGGLNGLGSALWFVLLVAVFAALGAWVGAEYNAFGSADLPNWFAQIDADDVTATAIAASATLVALSLIGGYVGGRLGEAYHTNVDAAVVEEGRKEV